MEQAYAHLAYLGHERIGLILGPRDHVPSRRKLEAFERAASAPRGSAPAEELVERTLFSLEGGHAAASKLIGAGVTGIICASDPLALGAIRAARRAGLSVPADLSVVGYDDSAFMNCTDPPLTTVRQPIEAIGRAAVELLVGQIEGARSRADELFFEPEIVARGSTATPRAPSASGAAVLATCAIVTQAVMKLANFVEFLQSVDECVNVALVTQIETIGARSQRSDAAPRRRAAAVVARRRRLPGLRPQLRRRRTATAPATSPACARGCRTCAISASTRSGSTPGTRRRWPTAATTSSTTARSTRRSARSPRPRS